MLRPAEMAGVCVAVIVFAPLVWLKLSSKARERLFAYLWLSGSAERMDRSTRTKKELLLADASLHGRVLDLGSGEGVNLRYLCGKSAPEVNEVVCIEPNSSLLEHLRSAAARAERDASNYGLDVRVTVFHGTLDDYEMQHGPACAHSFDCVTLFFVLCSVPGLEDTLSSLSRLLRRSECSRVVFMEHVGASKAHIRFAQRAVQPVWDLIGAGCQLCRDTGSVLARTGAETGAWDMKDIPRPGHDLVFGGGLVPCVYGYACGPETHDSLR